MDYNRVFIRGDTHGDFSWLPDWCEKTNTSVKDCLIILGDAGILYYGSSSKKEKELKSFISHQKITVLCVRGNHEDRPSSREEMKYVSFNNSPDSTDGYYYEEEYPNILYLYDGSIFNINNKRFFAIGGAYSVDKEYRLLMRYKWVSDEELNIGEMFDILCKLKNDSNHQFDFVLTHTCPIGCIPTDLFLSGIDQSKVSNRMENFLDNVANVIDFKHWYSGHFHDNRKNIQYVRSHCGQGDISMLFDEIIQII